MAAAGKRAPIGSGTHPATRLVHVWEHHMSYVQKVLQPGEEVRYQAAIHWVTYAHGAAWILAAGIVRLATPMSWRGGFIMDAITIVLVGGGLFFLARAW